MTVSWVHLAGGRPAAAREACRRITGSAVVTSFAAYFAVSGRASFWMGDAPGVRHELEALTGIDMAIALDPADPEVADARATSHRILAELGATAFLEQPERIVGRGATAGSATA